MLLKRGQGEPCGKLQAIYLLATMQPPGHIVGEVAEEHLRQLAQGREGIEAAARAAARAGHQQIGLLRHGQPRQRLRAMPSCRCPDPR